MLALQLRSFQHVIIPVAVEGLASHLHDDSRSIIENVRRLRRKPSTLLRRPNISENVRGLRRRPSSLSRRSNISFYFAHLFSTGQFFRERNCSPSRKLFLLREDSVFKGFRRHGKQTEIKI